MRDYAELAFAGHFNEAQSIRDDIQPLRDVHEKWLREPWLKYHVIPIAQLKAWAELIGLAAGPVRPPLLNLTKSERLELKQDLDRVGLIARVHQSRTPIS
jgi:4-hydroxy-tetrahydrodipicolinate synthase